MTKKEVRAKRRARRTTVRTIIIVIVMIAMCTMASFVDTHYTREAVVTYADDTCVIAVDDGGRNIWEFKATNLYKGQTIKMRMYTNNTTTIYDDEVVGVKVVAEVE